MSYPYFFINQENIEEDKIILKDSNFNHLVHVLRARIGDRVIISDNMHYKYHTAIEDISKKRVILVVNKTDPLEPVSVSVNLYQCLLKKNAMELVIQKATEIGSSAIIPVISERSIPEFGAGKINAKLNRWQEISDQAAGQSKRDFKCEVFQPVNLEHMDISDYGFFFLPYEGAGYKKDWLGTLILSRSAASGQLESVRQPVKNSRSRHDTANQPDKGGQPVKGLKEKIGVIIGPEGGLTHSDVEILKKKGAKTVNFGKNILRAETAAIYFLSVLDYMLKAR